MRIWRSVRLVYRATAQAMLTMCAAALLPAACMLPGESPLGDEVRDEKEEQVARIRDNPHDLEAHARLLELQVRHGDEEGAEVTVSHALRHNREDFRAYLLLAKYHRWREDLVEEERALLRARDIAPTRVEPRITLSSLYHQAFLEEQALEQRRLAWELADVRFQPELLLDYATACAQLGRLEPAHRHALALTGDNAASDYQRARAHILLCELSMRASEEVEALRHLREATRVNPREDGLVMYAGRLATVAADTAGLAGLYADLLASRDSAEARWGALYGMWMLSVRAAAESPLGPETERWRLRLEAISPGHPDVLIRHAQLLALDPARSAEAEAVLQQAREYNLGPPALAASLDGLLRLWRAEDALRVGVPGAALDELTHLMVLEPDLPGLRFLRAIALFSAREDDRCIAAIEAMDEADGDVGDALRSLRWWAMLRNGRAREVREELRERQVRPTNASLWVELVADFHLRREGGG
jgi:hypothetical protein